MYGKQTLKLGASHLYKESVGGLSELMDGTKQMPCPALLSDVQGRHLSQLRCVLHQQKT